jgi:excisionase family DNA binding protein
MTQKTMAAGRRALSVNESAIQIGIGRSLAWALVREGKLRTIRAGHRVLVPVQAIDDFLAGDTTNAEARHDG